MSLGTGHVGIAMKKCVWNRSINLQTFKLGVKTLQLYWSVTSLAGLRRHSN